MGGRYPGSVYSKVYAWAPLSIVALGDYDQSHLIRDFRAIVGTSPARYAAATTGT